MCSHTFWSYLRPQRGIFVATFGRDKTTSARRCNNKSPVGPLRENDVTFYDGVTMTMFQPNLPFWGMIILNPQPVLLWPSLHGGGGGGQWTCLLWGSSWSPTGEIHTFCTRQSSRPRWSLYRACFQFLSRILEYFLRRETKMKTPAEQFLKRYSRTLQLESGQVPMSATWTSTSTGAKMSRTTMDTTTTTVIRKIIGIISISTLYLSTRLQRRPPGYRDFEDGDKDQINMGTMTNVPETHFALHVYRQNPTQLTVPFDSTLLEGAFAGVNISCIL